MGATNTISCRSGANFRVGGSTGGTSKKFTATFLNEEACKLEAHRLCPNANGVTFSPGLGECWCETGMTGQNIDPTLRSCWFPGSNSGTGRLWSLGAVVPQAHIVTVGAVVAMTAAAVVGVATCLTALHRIKSNQRSQEALVSEE